MPQSKILGPYGYQQGLNTDASLVTVPKEQLVSLQNIVVMQEQLQPIPGFSTASIPQPPAAGSGTNYYTGMLGFVLSGSNYLFLPYSNIGGAGGIGVISLKNFTGSWSADIHGSSGFGGFFDMAFCVEVLNSVVTVGGQTAIISSSSPSGVAGQWTGSGNIGAFSGPTNTGIFKVVNNFLFALTNDGTLSWSNVGDSLTWNPASSITFRFGDGDYGVALGKIGNNLYIFKLNSIGVLQVNTVVLAGVVTLGPLYTLFDKMGTFSMRTIDNLPTGEIVFLGTDYNVYIFDGSNLTNISNRPYPESSIQGAINAFLNANSGISSNSMWVRVNPLQNTIYLTLGGQSGPGTTTGSISWAFDYVQDYWYQPTTIFSDFAYLPSIGNIGGFIPTSVSNLFIGLSETGTAIYSLSDFYTSFNGSSIPGQAIVSIPYTAESREMIPRSAIIPFTSNVANTVTITQGADGVYASSGIVPTLTGNLQRAIIPLNFKDSTMTTQIEFTTSSTQPFSISPIFLDAEVAH